MPVTNYVWDAENIVRELDEFGQTMAEYALNPQPYGDFVSQRRNGETRYYHYDALGSTRQLTDASETVTALPVPKRNHDQIQSSPWCEYLSARAQFEFGTHRSLDEPR